METLAKMKPAFKKDGTVTAGNASGINDGAAFFVLADADGGRQAAGHKPMARLVSYAVAGVPNEIMGEGPIPATKLALKKGGLTLDQMDVIESNEAFAAQAIAVARGLELDMKKTNPNGGAIALGHPIGCSGAFIATKAVYELQRTGGTLRAGDDVHRRRPGHRGGVRAAVIARRSAGSRPRLALQAVRCAGMAKRPTKPRSMWSFQRQTQRPAAPKPAREAMARPSAVASSTR